MKTFRQVAENLGGGGRFRAGTYTPTNLHPKALEFYKALRAAGLNPSELDWDEADKKEREPYVVIRDSDFKRSDDKKINAIFKKLKLDVDVTDKGGVHIEF